MVARDRLAIGRAGRVPLDMEWLLERRVRPVYGVEPDIRDDNDPEVANVFALYDAGKNTLLIRNSVLLKATHVEDPEAIFTIAHELGHICLHSNPTQFRRELPKKLPAKWCNPE
jgi:Zn-dependent peptidase ImmA (M78 family)